MLFLFEQEYNYGDNIKYIVTAKNKLDALAIIKIRIEKIANYNDDYLIDFNMSKFKIKELKDDTSGIIDESYIYHGR